ncbi:hypothetical protein BP00DRAFT_147115 [Aspergillus indologenus CBS 114.80]|uniref:Uncharacterized protein n=1 Tax=Aspergillus indologenus CBS 114.80 TaxID=1450541 RepID=A0A2V5IV60_9EURO|nr:hypothetical protein BP00DRAFT_147115 [Aspergillus indologenus CBS 114.80]
MGDQGAARLSLKKSLSHLCHRLEQTQVVRRHLQSIFRAVEESKQTFLTADRLKELNIEVSSLELEAAGTAKFYQPCPENELVVIKWDEVELWRWDEGRAEEPARVDHNLFKVWHQIWAYKFLNDLKIDWEYCDNHPVTGRAEYPPRHPYQWIAHNESNSTSFKPHFAMQVMHDAEPEEQLSRGEILPITAYMGFRLKDYQYVQHYYMPILVFSIFRSQARILQAYHDGTYLHISKSGFYDFKEDNRTNYELFVRWLCCKPCGETRIPLHVQGEGLDERTVKELRSYLKKALNIGIAKKSADS